MTLYLILSHIFEYRTKFNDRKNKSKIFPELEKNFQNFYLSLGYAAQERKLLHRFLTKFQKNYYNYRFATRPFIIDAREGGLIRFENEAPLIRKTTKKSDFI